MLLITVAGVSNTGSLLHSGVTPSQITLKPLNVLRMIIVNRFLAIGFNSNVLHLEVRCRQTPSPYGF